MKIVQTNKSSDYEKVYPNFIYNRFDLFSKPEDFFALKIKNGREVKFVEYTVKDNQLELGLWLVPITQDEMDELLFYVTQKHPQVQKIIYKNALIPKGKAKSHNHFRIVFPETVEEMESRVASKSRAKMRKKIRRAEEIWGPMEILEYDRGNMPDAVVDKFFEFKLAIRGRKYNMTAREYLDRYHVSHSYVLKFGDTIGAIRFSCEQCPVVYGENFTYNPEMSEYSLGRYVFYHHLIRMVEKKHPELFFAGGDYEYKKHYGSIEETLYDCVIQVEDLDFTELLEQRKVVRRAKNWMKGHLPEKMVKILQKINEKLKI